MEKKIVLSIGIIFKNEIRCLERCLKSLEPLRRAVPSELVMADTGSEDGSREVAEKYADILFDFPWINDFAAARNAVMDRCSGEWYFSIDADEWLDDIEELKKFFLQGRKDQFDACGLTERNYDTYDTNGGYSTFIACRLLRMSTGLRFRGAIHEIWDLSETRNLALTKAVLHHDGYVEMYSGSAAGREKRERNLTLLRQKLEDNPEDLQTHLQFIESGGMDPRFEETLRNGLELVEDHARGWEKTGPSIFRHAIFYGRKKKLPETEEWIQKMEELFPESYFTRIDVAFTAAIYYYEKEDYFESARWGEIALRAYEDYRAGRGDLVGQVFGSLQCTSPRNEVTLKIVLTRAYYETGREDDALALLSGLDCTLLDVQWTNNLLETLQMFQFKSEMDLSSLIVKVWEDIQRPEPNEEWAEKRRKGFFRTGIRRFELDNLANEVHDRSFRRPVYTLYIPLKGKCELGTAAAILASDSAEEMKELLGSVKDWEELPVSALAHAIEKGVQFPPEGQTINIEVLDMMAAQLAKDPEVQHRILKQVMDEDLAGSWHTLSWVRSLVLAAVQLYKWDDESTGLWLARTLAKVEQVFIPGCYTPEVLQEGNLFVLPPMHRFGWYCVQAFEALDAGDTVGYVQFLHKGLASYGGMKDMVEFLTDVTPELKMKKPDPELLELAELVRTMLAAYSPDDPAVAALKASPSYKRVAYLIEGEGK